MTQSRAELEKLKVPDLRKLCKEYNVLAYSKLNKKDLVDKVVTALSAAFSGTASNATQLESVGTGAGTLSHQNTVLDTVAPRYQQAEHFPAAGAGRAFPLDISNLPPASSSRKNVSSSAMASPSGITSRSRTPSVLDFGNILPATPARATPTTRGLNAVVQHLAAVAVPTTPVIRNSRIAGQDMLPPASATQPINTPDPSSINASYLPPSQTPAPPTPQSEPIPIRAPTPAHAPIPASSQAPTVVRRRPKRQLVEMTEADYAELERMKRPKRGGVTSSQNSAPNSQALQKNASSMSSVSFAPDHLRGAPSMAPPSQYPESQSRRPVRNPSQNTVVDKSSRESKFLALLQPSPSQCRGAMKDPSQDVTVTSPSQQRATTRISLQAVPAASPLARPIRTEARDVATAAVTTLTTDTSATSNPQPMIVPSEIPFTPVKVAHKDQNVHDTPHIRAVSVLQEPLTSIVPPQTPTSANPVKTKTAKKHKTVTPSAQKPKSDITTKSRTKGPAKEKKASSSSIQTASGKSSASKFAPLKVVRAPVTTERESHPPILVTLELAEKPLEFPAGCTISDIDKIIKPSFLERLYRANKAAAGRPVPNDEMAFDGLADSMLDGTVSAENLNVAIRFVIARIHTRFQLGEWKDPVGFAPVQRVKKLCDGIWVAETLEMTVDQAKMESETSTAKATGKTRGKSKGKAKGKAKSNMTEEDIPSNEPRIVRYLLVGETGDVISRFEQPIDMFTPSDIRLGNFNLRPDWQAYLQTKIDTSRVPSLSATLLDRVRTKDPDEYPQGIARTWLKRMEHDLDSDVVRLAKRYVLSNVVLNSISGELLSAMQMDAIWAGKAGAEVRPKDWKTVSLFLPESHQVEGVGFSITSNGKKLNLHPAIGLVARKNGEDLVLRTTGQVVGSVDQGVSELYKHVLGCDDRGIAVGHEEAEKLAQKFWSGFNQIPED